MSREQNKGQIPPAQTRAPEIPALQTPPNEERSKKRDREEATSISGPTEQPGVKRQRLNPLSEEEVIKEMTDSPRGERVVSQQTSPVIEISASSHRQELERQHSVEVSSTKPQRK